MALTLNSKWLADLNELEHPEELQQMLAAVYLFSHLPVLDLAHCTPKEIERIAAPVKHGQ